MEKNSYSALSTVELTVQSEDIFYISWIIDACEGLGFLMTNDARAGKITVFTPSSQLDVLRSLFDGLKSEGLSVHIDDIK